MSDENLDLSRRDALRNLGITLTLTTAGAGVVSAQDAAHVHHLVTQEKTAGPYQPKCFNPHEYATLRRLSELIMPADEHSKSAIEAGAPEFIDLLASRNDELAHIYTGGLAWLDQEIERRHGSTFLAAAPEQQTAMLDLIAYRKNESPELGPGIRFFAWVRNMVVDAYFTSKIGMDYLGFMGNGAMSHFSVPQAAIDYALKRSPLA
ncbi:MAG TPA: gluconate 2-dehydrogenase subunit 3 family protein [Bryobacteraceae bacterium]|nr:gluconate 2-dehydrogenase subunit 3 family protein [Bryobacteraceae bacterium]